MARKQEIECTPWAKNKQATHGNLLFSPLLLDAGLRPEVREIVGASPF